jgi:hypothetical protein
MLLISKLFAEVGQAAEGESGGRVYSSGGIIDVVDMGFLYGRGRYGDFDVVVK